MKNPNQVAKALQFIEEHLTRQISLEDIADAANFSQWYFHRLFRVLTGYCVNDYLRRRRLCEASHELLYTDRPIREIALKYQFESQAAFTRSFKSVAGITPGRCRRQIASLIRFPALRPEAYFHPKKGVKMQEPRFVKKDSFNVIGVNCKSDPSQSLHKLWQSFGERYAEIPNVTDPGRAYQVCVFEAPSPTEEYTFIAGMEVSDISQVPPAMITHRVPAAEYAVFEHHGSLEKMHQSYEYIFGVWLQENGYQMAEADSLEIYDERFNPQSSDSIFEIWIPIVKA